MAQPIWQTPGGSLGTIPEGLFFRQTLIAVDPDSGPVTYSFIAGQLPAGIQISGDGTISGVPQSVATVQGVPTLVDRDITSKFVIRATAGNRIADRTFTLTVTGNDTPEFIIPAGNIGTYYDGDYVNLQVEFEDQDPSDRPVVSLISGFLPPGLKLSPDGLISGYIAPASPILQPPGYSLTSSDTEPYDFVVQFINRNYQFTLEVSDGKSTDIRTYTIFVYARNTITADTTLITADNGFVTADQTNIRAPFLLNFEPSNLGDVRSDNNYAYQFIGDDYDTPSISYAISVNEGEGLPPGLELDPATGWLYGEIPDQGTTQVRYSFNITVYQTDPVGTAVKCIGTNAGTNIITCATTAPFADQAQWFINPELSQPLYIPIKLSGQMLGGLSDAGEKLYYVLYVFSNTTFNITDSTSSTTPVNLTTTTPSLISAGSFVIGVEYVIVNVGNTDFTLIGAAENQAGIVFTATGIGSGTGQVVLASSVMDAGTVITSPPYPFNLTIVGDIDSEITWLTDSDLGTIFNGETSLLKVEAVNRGGRELEYKLASGLFNSLPQGLQLLPSGEIAGRVTFNTFAIDLGTTTIDNNTTTWDSQFDFTVNAYAPDTEQILYNVSEVRVIDGGLGYSSLTPPTLVFSSPFGASAVTAVAGNVNIVSGSIVSVELANQGAGYTGDTGQPGSATITITEGFGGSGAILEAVMQPSGTRDVVSAFKTFTLRVVRDVNAPYQNLYVEAMPPKSDRELIQSLLTNNNIFIPEYIFRPDDPNFGLSTQVVYQHAYGLAPRALDVYVESLYLNHYWKNLVLGQIETAVARDINDNIVYEVVYSRIIDNEVNEFGQSVSKILPLPYPIPDPINPEEQIRVVYPNSLANMRDQVVDVVGQISNTLPLWMTSKQQDGRVLGFTPAWVIAYVKPGRSKQIAYYLNSQFGEQLNQIDFKVDRYIIDRSLSLNWDPETQNWTPEPSLTTFDRFDTSNFNFIGNVSIATSLAFSDVNNRTLDYIASLGGLDGNVQNIENNTIIFVKQENYNGPPGSSYATTDDGWQIFDVLYDGGRYDQGTPFPVQTFDAGSTVSDGFQVICTNTNSTTNQITCDSTTGMRIGDPIWFIGTTFGTILPFTPGNKFYYIFSIDSATEFKIAETPTSLNPLSLSAGSGTMAGSFGNDRMGIWRINVDPITQIVNLTLITQTVPNQYVQISRGSQFRSAQLYRPTTPGTDLTRISWLPLVTIVTPETIFDQGSVDFIEPVDMYNPGEINDKYIVFPKTNILV
jgi:hypothetical protein